MAKTSFKQKTGLVLLGVFLSIVLLEILLTLSGMLYLSIQEHRNRKSIEKENTFRILCLGESTTALNDGHSYPRQLETILNSRNLGVQFSVIDKGVPGMYTKDILAHLNENLAQYRPDMVITMMGINDPPAEKKDHFKYFASFKVYKLISYLYQSLANERGPFSLAATFLSSVKSKSVEYYAAGEASLARGNLEQAKTMFARSIEADPRNHEAYSSLAECYLREENYAKAEEVYLLNKKNNPNNTDVYDDLAEIYYLQQKYDDMRQILMAALNIKPFYVKSYVQLARYNRLQGKNGEAETILKEGLLRMPKFFHGEIYAELAQLYSAMGKSPQDIENMYKKALETNPDNDQLAGMLGVHYLESGNEKMAEQYFAASDEIRQTHYNAQTIMNYQSLRNILIKKRIPLVAMQYAMRDVRALKQILGNNNDILFVDNEQSFRRAIKEESYDEYFTDKFAGDFGHCTAKGDRLIAENAAQAIVERYFRK